MNVRKTDDSTLDVERQAEWYAIHAGWKVADRYLDTVEATCRLLGEHPQLGPRGGLAHALLRDWRFFLLFRPFHKHILFYQVLADEVLLRRAMHGHRDLPRRLLEPPEPPERRRNRAATRRPWPRPSWWCLAQPLVRGCSWPPGDSKWNRSLSTNLVVRASSLHPRDSWSLGMAVEAK
ncbi:MAG: type II toxin-antitoxin system RelE/ParE family toxin [Verrucomicrobiales bacterium]|nr:type II toxin-antitoxin system RelE/ParE family toxin [Verrucomicrobiales bacterium]